MPARLLVLCTALALAAGCGGDKPAATPPATPTSTQAPAPAEPEEAEPTISGASCLAPGNGTKSVRFASEDRLAGYLMGAGRRFVILAHQSDGDACQMFQLGVELEAAGYRVLALDFSGTGKSRLPASAETRVAVDLAEAVAYARDRGARSVGVIGASMGGLAALAAGARVQPPMDAVVALSAPTEFGTEQVPSLRGFPSPLQVYVARDDSYFTADARAFVREDRSAQLILLPGFSHGIALVDDALFARIEQFLGNHLR